MTLEHTPPKLTPAGEQLLSDVLAARAATSETTVLNRTDEALDDVAGRVPSEPLEAPIHPLTVALPVFIVLGGLLAAAMFSMGLGGEATELGSVDVEVAGVVEERVERLSSVAVTVLSTQTPNEGIRRFDLRLEALNGATSIAPERFDVDAFDQSGNPVTTIARMSSSGRDTDGFIDMMVRVEGARSSTIVVHVLVDGLVVEQLLID